MVVVVHVVVVVAASAVVVVVALALAVDVAVAEVRLPQRVFILGCLREFVMCVGAERWEWESGWVRE